MDDQRSDRLDQPEEDEGRPAGPSTANRPPAKWKDVAEDAIQEAMRSGAFDDLPGRGKPLKLLNNPYAPGTELAYQLLKDNQYTLPWISERVSLLARIESLRQEISRSWSDLRAAVQATGDKSARQDLARQWGAFLPLWREHIADLNKAIATLNLKQPGDQLEIMKLALEAELIRAGAAKTLE